MNERTLNEFALYFKRVIRIERYLKDLIIEKYMQTYGVKTYCLIYNLYLKYLRCKSSGEETIFQEINALKNKTDIEKLNLCIDRMYISEVLSFFSHRIYLKDITRKTFFTKEIKTSKNAFRRTGKILKDFRNCICHYDIKQFYIEKDRFIETLLFFEKLLDCRYRFTSGAIESISHNLNIKSICKLIYQHNPEYFDDDRVLVNVFDDIAVLSGYRAGDLPPYKSIIRAKYYIEAELKRAGNSSKKSVN